ncbi:MAG: protein translocase subunit SecD, partial [Pseudomonadota bacterium]
MTKIRNKFIFLGIIILLAFLFSVPSFQKDLPAPLKRILSTDGMRLGLDLQGGMHILLKVNLNRAVQNHLDLAVSDLKEILHKRKIPVKRIETVGADRIRLSLAAQDASRPLKKILKEEFPNLTILSSSDETGGGQVDLGLKSQEIQNIKENAVTQTLEILRNRIDQFGVSEPLIVRQGKDEIVVQLPGVKDHQRALDLIGRTAQLEFKFVDMETELVLPGLIEKALASGRLKEDYTHQELNRALRGIIPPNDEVYLMKESDRGSATPILLKKKTVMTGETIKTAQVQIGGDFNEPYVAITLNARGARLFDRITQENVGRRLAIILDDVVQSTPVIRERISGGKAQISGSFTPEEAHDLAIVLRAGALPAPVDMVQNLTVGPSLGRDSIQSGIASAVLGTVLVVSFMIIYYRLSGVIANLAL